MAGLSEFENLKEKMDASIDNSQVRELDLRRGYGIGVALLWEPESDNVFVSVREDGTNELLQFQVDRGEALDGFHHPYAHAPRLAA